jgi:hypothetical protein
MQTFFRYPILMISLLLSAFYLIVLILLFLIHSFSVVLVIPFRLLEGNFSYDFSKEPPRKLGFTALLSSIYAFELRGDRVWETLYDHFVMPHRPTGKYRRPHDRV